MKLTHLLTAILLSTLSVHAGARAPVCADLFAKPSLVARASRAAIERAIKFLPEQTQGHSWPAVLAKIDFQSPYSIYSDLAHARDEVHRVIELIEKNDVAAIDAWAATEQHALVLYDLLAKRGLGHSMALVRELRERNVFFADATPQPSGALLTYSFEKEGRGHEISMLYRPPTVSEKEWFDKTDAERMSELSAMKLPYKTFFPPSVVAPTELKPSYLSGYSIDPGNLLHKSISWEVVHKAYEISLHRTMNEVRDISKFFGETSSFHVHAVFELPREYPKFAEFRYWFKSLNDALYLRGMEEGLHGTELTGILNLPEDGGRGRFLSRGLRLNSLGDISKRNTKFYSAGLRADIYGPASSTELVKLGIELRDSTRSLDRLDASLQQISHSLATRAWERVEVAPSTPLFRLSTNSNRSLALLKEAGIRADVAERIVDAELTGAIPLLPFERGATINYRTGKPEFATASYAARVKRARAKYIESLHALEVEIDDFTARGIKVEKGELELAIRQCLTDWAKIARASERMSY